jgi:hypothetical protein
MPGFIVHNNRHSGTHHQSSRQSAMQSRDPRSIKASTLCNRLTAPIGRAERVIPSVILGLPMGLARIAEVGPIR